MFHRRPAAAVAAAALPCALLFAAPCVGAAEPEPAAAAEAQSDGGRRWFVTSGFLSRQGRDRNEHSRGVGFELQADSQWWLSAGRYRNSAWKHSRYLHAVYAPAFGRLRFDAATLQLGLAAGWVDGYPQRNGGRFAPALLPMAALTLPLSDRGPVQTLGLNLSYIPSLGASGVAGAWALQAKFGF